MNKKVVIIGASGHGKVIADIVENSGDVVVGFLDDYIEEGTKIYDYKVLGDCTCAHLYNDCEFIIGIGNNDIRKQKSETLNLKWYTAIHPSATISKNVDIAPGTVVMANAVINIDTHIGVHSIINTGSIIEHDCVVGDYVHISPNATICGCSNIGDKVHIGASATVINVKKITSNCVIGAGSVVIKDIEEEGTYVGVPARRIK